MRRTTQLSAMVATLLQLTGTHTALAAEPTPAVLSPQSPPPATPSKGRWYGNQTLILDGIALGLVGTDLVTKRSGFAAAGVALYALGAPTAHLVHDNYGYAGASFGMRVVLPVVALLIVAPPDRTRLGTRSDPDTQPAWAPGAIVFSSLLVGPILDAIGLAYDTSVPMVSLVPARVGGREFPVLTLRWKL